MKQIDSVPFEDDLTTADAEFARSVAIAFGGRTSYHADGTSSDFCVSERLRRGGFTLAVGNISSPGAASKRQVHAAKRRFRMAALAHAQPGSILDELEDVEAVDGPERNASSLFVATIEPDKGVLTYAASGSGGAIVFRDVTRHEHLDFARNSSAGAERLSSVQRTIAFPPGSALIAYTDGVARASGKVDGLPLGSGGLARIVHRVLRASAAPVCSTLWREIDRFTGGSYRYDATLALVIALEG